jgi:LCP family protein required for cell wall assembly
VNQLESALHTLAHDPFEEPAPFNLADRALERAQTRDRTRRRGVLAVVGTATVAALVMFGVNTTADEQQARPPAAPATSAPTFAQPRTNVLLIGSDAEPDRIGVRPDTMMLVSIDTRTGDSALISLPRNLQKAPFPPGSPGARAWPNGYDCGPECLLNSIWTWAEQSREYRKYANPGLTATTQAIEQITGLGVDETVVVTMAALTRLVDAVGGVDLTVPERLPIGGTATNHQGTQGWIEEGEQHLDGYHALWYARSRWSTDDYDRMRRQQCLIAALTDQLDVRKLLTDYPRIAASLRHDLSTSIRVDDLATWAGLAIRMRGGQLQRVGLVPQDPQHPDFAELRDLVSRVLTKAPVATGGGWVSEGRC